MQIVKNLRKLSESVYVTKTSPTKPRHQTPTPPKKIMKTKPIHSRRGFAILVASTLLVGSIAHADTLYWDGTDTDPNTADGGAGTWDNGLTANWDTAASGGADDVWDNAFPDSAVFGGAAGTVTTAGNITAGGISFLTAGYNVRLGTTHTLTVNNISMTGAGDAFFSGTTTTTGNHTVSNGGSTLTITTDNVDGRVSFARIGASNSRYIDMTGAGGTTISGSGSVNMRVLSNTTSGPVSISGGSTVWVNNGTSHAANIGSSLGTGNVDVNGGGVFLGYFNGSFRSTLGSGAGQLQFTNGGSSGFTANGSWDVRLNNNTNTVQWGSAFFNMDTLVLQNQHSGGASTLTFVNGLDLNGAQRTIHSGQTAGATTSKAVISGVISNTSGTAAGITKTGNGLLELTANNTYDGNTNINDGTLAITGAGRLGSGSYGGAINNAASFVYSSSNDQTLSGVISGAGSLTKDTSSTSVLTLTGNNDYTGATTVNAGSLIINGSTSTTSIVSVASGATLGGANGTVGGATTVNGTLASGAAGGGIGTLNFSNALSLASTANYLFELTGGGSTADLSNVGGALTLSDATLDLIQLGTYTIGDKFTLFGYLAASGLTGTFAGLTDGATFTQAGGDWQISYADSTSGLNGGTGDTFATITAIPELSSALLGGLGFLLLLRRRR